MNNLAVAVSTQKRYRQGQILKLVTGDAISSQDELRKRLAHIKLPVTQATLSRDLRELKLVKTGSGYKPLAAPAAEATPLSALAQGSKGIPFRRSPGRKYAGAEDTSERRATIGGRGGRRTFP